MVNSTESEIPKLLDSIRHEEGLIHNRLTWMLQIQGFLFAAISFAATQQTQERYPHLFKTTAIVGMSIAFLTLLGISAAYIAIGQARRLHSTQIFGGSHFAKWLGRTNSLGLCVILTVAWIVIYFM